VESESSEVGDTVGWQSRLRWTRWSSNHGRARPHGDGLGPRVVERRPRWATATIGATPGGASTPAVDLAWPTTSSVLGA
jgi:hypothetical protein